MPRNTDSGSSDTGIVTRSSTALSDGDARKQVHLTVPCSVTLDKLRESSNKFVLKHGSGYYTITKGDSLRYRIEGIKVLRTRNRSMPTSTKKGGNKMNRPDPRGEGYRRFPPSRDSSFLNASQGDYPPQGRFDARYSGPYQSRGRDNRYEQRRHWPPRGNYGNRGSRDSYGRDFNNSRGQFGRRASSYPDEAIGEHSRHERVPQGDREGAMRFQERRGRYPNQNTQKRRHQSGSSLEDTPKSLSSTYKKSDKSELSNHATSQKTPVNEDSKQLSKESKLFKDDALNNERTTQNHTLNKDKSNSSAASPSLSNSGASKATQDTPSVTAKPNTEKQKRKAVLMLQQIESLKSNSPKTNVDQTKEMPVKKSEDISIPNSRPGNGDNSKGSPHRTEISVPNHIDGEKSSAKETEGSSSGESENAGASPKRLHSARKSAPTSGVSRTQKSDMLKKQALLKQSQSAQSPPPDNVSNTPSARMGVKERKPVQKDSAESSPVNVPEENDTSKSSNDNNSITLTEKASITLTEEALTPPPSEDLEVLSDTEGSVLETSLHDIEVMSEESELQKSKEPEKKFEDQKAVSDDTPSTFVTGDAVKSDEPEMSSAVGKMVLKIKENLKKKLSKGNVSPRTSSSSSSRVGSRPSSSCSVESTMDVSEKTDTPDTDTSEDHQKDKNEVSAESSSLPDTNECQVSSEIPDNEPKVNGKEVSDDTLSNKNTSCTGDNKDINCDDVVIVGADKQSAHPDDVQCLEGETQPFQVSNEPLADQMDHICNDSSKISSAPEPEKSDSVNSPCIADGIVKTCSSLSEQCEEATVKKDDVTLPKVADSIENIEDLSDGSVDLGPHEPGDMDAMDDDLLLEDDPVIMSEGYNPEPDKMDTSELSEAHDSEVTELAITKVESQSEDVLQAGWDQPNPSKRTLAGDVEDVEDEPVCKKSRTETENVIEGVECPPESEEVADLEASKKPVIFSHSEWKDFAQSIKEKYERLVQTFNQKTNVMYEAQAHWQQETNSWKDKYDKLEQKYKDIVIQVKERSVVEKQDVEVQTTFTHKTKLSRRRKKEGSRHGSPKPSQETPSEGGEAMETEQGTTSSSDVPVSSGTPPPPTSDFEPSAASSSRSNTSPDTQASSKSTNLESKREVFRATLNKVMLNKMNLSGASEAGTSSDAPSGKPSQDTASQTKANAHNMSTEKPGTPDGAIASAPETNQTSEESPMDTSQSGSKTTEPSATTDAASTETMPIKGPKVAINASGTATAASHPQETISSAPTPSNMKTSNRSSNSEAISSQAIPSPSKSLTSTSGAGPAASPSKAPSQSSEKTNVPSATDSSKLPGSPKHSTGTASIKVPETSKDSSKKSSTETKKDPSVGKPTKSAMAPDEPEVIDLTDEPELPAESSSKPSGPSPHKQDALPASKFTTLATRSPHALLNSPSVSSPSPVERAPSVFVVSSSITSPATSGTVSVSANARQVANIGQNLVSQNATQRTSQRIAAVQPASIASRTGSTPGSVSSPKRNSPGVPQSVSPQSNKQSSSSANIQLRNVNPPVVTTQGSNPRSQVVSLQHGPRQQVPPAGRGHPQTSQVSTQQRQMSSSQRPAVATIAGLQPVMTTIQNQARMQGQVAMAQRLQQEQQQISLNMLQQGRQGVHQLPGAAASAAALATRQPGQAWLQQIRPGQVTSTQQQSLQVCQQIQLPTGQIQLQMVRPVGAGAPQTLPTSTLQSGSQLAIQQQQQQQTHYQNVARSQASTQEQIQAQERTHAANRAQAAAKAAREQREQEQLQQARIAAQRLQSSQQDQQQVQRAQIKKLQEEQTTVKSQQQQHQNKMRLILSQIQRSEEYQQSLRNKLSATHSGMNRQVYRNCQKQLQDMQQQEAKLRTELGIVESALAECRNKSSKLEQQLRMATRLSPQELQQHQLQQQQQQFNQQLAQRQIQQQRNPQQQQQQQQIQLQVQQKQDMTKAQKHPAPLPDLKTVLDLPRTILFTPLPIRPLLEIKHSQEGIVLSWKADPDGGASKVEVMRYLLYAYQESESATPSTDLWKKIGAVDALPLPMACTLTHFKAGSMYHFAVCAISKHKRPGAFSNIGSINLP